MGWLGILPSGAAMLVYDAEGKLIDWTRDGPVPAIPTQEKGTFITEGAEIEVSCTEYDFPHIILIPLLVRTLLRELYRRQGYAIYEGVPAGTWFNPFLFGVMIAVDIGIAIENSVRKILDQDVGFIEAPAAPRPRKTAAKRE